MKINDKVKIKNKNIKGEIIDIYEVNGQTYYSVETIDKKVNEKGGYGVIFPIFDCSADEIEVINKNVTE